VPGREALRRMKIFSKIDVLWNLMFLSLIKSDGVLIAIS